MKEETIKYLVVYPGHNMASYLYQRLLRKPCKVEIVATPSKISAGCSQSIKFQEEDMELVIAEVQKMNTPPKGVYKIIRNGYYEKIR